MRSYASSVTINAGPEAVWDVLVDGASYPAWDSGVERVEGRIAAGETIKVFSEVQPGRAFPVKVVEFEPGRKMTWASGMPLGLFKGRRTFALTPSGDTLRFDIREEFTGPLLPLIGRSIPDLQPSFDKFANGLKKRVETGS